MQVSPLPQNYAGLTPGVHSLTTIATNPQSNQSPSSPSSPAGELHSSFNFELHNVMTAVAQGYQNMTLLAAATQAARDILPEHYHYLTNFLESHDKPLFMDLVARDLGLYKNFYSFLLVTEGVPVVYYLALQWEPGVNPRGTAWNVSEGDSYGVGSDLHKFFKALIQQRKKVQLWKYNQQEVCVTDHYMILARGPVLLVMNNIQPGREEVDYSHHLDCQTTLVPELKGRRLVNLYSRKVKGWRGGLVHGMESFSNLIRVF